MTTKVIIEFDVTDRAAFLADLEEWDKLQERQADKGETHTVVGYRAEAEDTVKTRAPLAAFADMMERKLRKNDTKTSWANMPVEALFRLLMIEIEEFKIAYEYFTVGEARGETIDVANYAMILWDRLNALDQSKKPGIKL